MFMPLQDYKSVLQEQKFAKYTKKNPYGKNITIIIFNIVVEHYTAIMKSLKS